MRCWALGPGNRSRGRGEISAVSLLWAVGVSDVLQRPRRVGHGRSALHCNPSPAGADVWGNPALFSWTPRADRLWPVSRRTTSAGRGSSGAIRIRLGRPQGKAVFSMGFGSSTAWLFSTSSASTTSGGSCPIGRFSGPEGSRRAGVGSHRTHGELFRAVTAKVSPGALVAEDLGTITPMSAPLLDRLGLPGTRGFSSLPSALSRGPGVMPQRAEGFRLHGHPRQQHRAGWFEEAKKERRRTI